MCIRLSIAVSVAVMMLIGCGSDTADPAAAARASQSPPQSSSNSGSTVPVVLRSTIAGTLKVDESRVTPSASFATDLGADELDTVELVMAYERVFKVDIRDPDADHFKQVQDVMAFLRRHQALR